MLAENWKTRAAAAGPEYQGLNYAASSILMRSDFRKRTSFALMLSSGSPFLVRVPTSSGEVSPASSCLLKPTVASNTRKTSNPSCLILEITCAICSDSARVPLMASPSSFISCLKRVFTQNSCPTNDWMPLVLPAFYSFVMIRPFSGYNKQNARDLHSQKCRPNRCKERQVAQSHLCWHKVSRPFFQPGLLCFLAPDHRASVRCLYLGWRQRSGAGIL